jgi:hypothetical protein
MPHIMLADHGLQPNILSNSSKEAPIPTTLPKEATSWGAAFFFLSHISYVKKNLLHKYGFEL